MKKPFLLFITCDELQRETLGIYGNKAISTPNIDSIAKKGRRFDCAHTVSPWCLPARCSMLTGLYPHRSGAYSNFRKCPLDTGVTNLFKELKKAAYTVNMFGKCHFAPVPYGRTRPELTLPYDEFKDYYLSLGLDRLDLQDDKQVSVWFMDDWAKDAEADGTLKAYRDAVWNLKYGKVFPFPARQEMHPDIWVADRAVSFIENADGDSSHFAWVSFSGPHYPMDSPQSYIDRVDASKLTPVIKKDGELDNPLRIHHKSYHGGGNIDGASQARDHACKNFSEDYWQRLRVNYNANVLLIDDMVGRILEAAKKKFGDNVITVFTADHGEMLGNHGLWGKHNCAYSEVWRIPLFVSYPGHIEEGELSDALANTCDILPTFLEGAGAQAITCDGESLFLPSSRQYTFAEGEGYIAVTDGRYKYVHIHKTGESYAELIDTLEDPHEFENRIDHEEYSFVLARLSREIVTHFMNTVLP